MIKGLKDYREEARLTQFQLATVEGLGGSGNLANIENFKRNLTVSTATKLAPALGVSVQELLMNHALADVVAAKGIYEQSIAANDEEIASREAIEFVKYLIDRVEDIEHLENTRKRFIAIAEIIKKGLEEDIKQLEREPRG